ncbi:YdeI/OmpD-associated family protein [Pontibacter sp. SGAir0037]|uniref:YdeI/OmpD-associated family protein n=1 Tax=Pontibacter sp. SGAir0037 TaxID=2571030 RepID=UPI0010CD2BA7|nr:YdeI/OmpD-associated family protein [Pontibacter sp. SGAir0037]QCR24176.1 hypothetical protein C1N53_18650 [Pontibacter sp. SGAir0037]
MQDIIQKLQLKPNQRLLLINAPKEFEARLVKEGYSYATAVAGTDIREIYDAVQLFVQHTSDVDALAPVAAKAIRPGGLLWIAYPKKSSAIASDITRDSGWQAIAALGYEGVRQIAIDDTWSSLRFRHTSERPAPSKMGATYPGIDTTTRTVTPPADLQEALAEAGLTGVFDGLAFTHKKEYVVAVLQARKPETRASRIQKTIEKLTGLKQDQT